MSQSDSRGATPNERNSGFTAPSTEFGILDLLQVVADNLKLLIFGPLAVGAISLGASYLITPTFTATNTFLPPQQQQSFASSMLQSLGGLSALAGGGAIKSPTDQYVSFLKSRTVQDRLVDRFKLLERYEKTLRRDARRQLENNTKIKTGKDNLISVDFDDASPEFAADVANGYVAELSQLLNSLAVTEAQQRLVFFERQLSFTKDSLIKAEQALAASGVSVSAINANPLTAVEVPARLRAQATALEVRLASLRTTLTNQAPEVRQVQAELNALRSQLSSAEKEQPNRATGGNDYIAKYREFRYQETLFELFSKQYEVAKIDESREGSMIQVVDTALPPEAKSKPARLKLLMVSVFGTGVLLILLIFLSRFLTYQCRDAEFNEKWVRLKSSLGRRPR